MKFEKFKKVLREIMSEPGSNGTLSWGRVMATITSLAAIVWGSKILLQTHALPPDLVGLSAFGLGPYATNKAITAAQGFSGNPVNETTPAAPVIPVDPSNQLVDPVPQRPPQA